MSDIRDMLLKKQAQLLDSYNQILGAIQVVNDLMAELDNPQKEDALTMDELKGALGVQSVEVIENES